MKPGLGAILVMSAMQGMGCVVAARRVFISHTSELREFPADGSYVAAVEQAVKRTRDAPVDMEYFTASDHGSAEVSQDGVADCDVFVLVAGFRYGSPVRNRPEVSHTELEFEVATERGMPRLVFLLAEDAEGPAGLFRDLKHAARQEAFRQRLLLDSGVVVKAVKTPGDLDAAVFQALTELTGSTTSPEAGQGGMRVWNVPARLEGFTGREALLEALHGELAGDEPVVVRAIAGMGGIGKTSTAIEYVHRHAASYDVVWWVPAEQSNLVPQHLAGLARSLKLATDSDSVDIALARVLGEIRRWPRSLLVFDNAEDPNALRPYLPGGTTRVLITSRNAHWTGIATPIPVDVLTPDESRTLLTHRLPHLTPTEADAIADALGHLPSALEQAAATLREGVLTPDTYVRLLSDRAHDLLQQHPDLIDEPSTPPDASTSQAGVKRISVAASWSLAFDTLTNHDPAGLQLLTLLAWLAPEPFPHTLIPDHVDLLPAPLAQTAADPLAYTATLHRLSSRALARITPDTIQLHRIPALLLRTSHPAGEHRAQDPGIGWPATALHLLDEATNHLYPWDNPPTWPTWQRLLPHVLTTTAPDRSIHLTDHHTPHADLLRAASAYLTTRGQPTQALPHARQAHTLNQHHHGPDHPNTLGSASNLAINLRALGESQAARELDEDTLSRYRRILGDDHPDTLSSASNLAVGLWALGELQAARELDEDTLNRRRHLHGDDHPNTLTSASNLAVDLGELGELQAARELNEETLNRRRRTLGDDHPNTLTSAHNLAIDRHELGELQAARELNEDTLNRYRRTLGNDHPDTLRTARNLDLLLEELGEPGAAH